MPSPSVSAPTDIAANPVRRWWAVVVALACNLLASLPLAWAVAALDDPGYVSDPDVARMLVRIFLGLVLVIALGITSLCVVWTEGSRRAVLAAAVVGLVVPAAVVQPWA